MSELSNYIRESVLAYLSNEVTMDAFRQAFVGAYYHARSLSADDREANQMASALMLPYAEFSGGHRSEQSFREELVNAIRPFLVSNTTTVLKLHPSRSWMLANSGSAGSAVVLVDAASF